MEKALTWRERFGFRILLCIASYMLRTLPEDFTKELRAIETHFYVTSKNEQEL